MSRVRKSAAVATIGVAVIGGAEGLRQKAYPDPATRGPPWTVCFGHTGPEVTPGYYASIQECKNILISDMDKTGDKIEVCVPALISAPPERYVAALSLAFNIGTGAFCRSSIADNLNRGRVQEACDAFLKYNRAAGIVFPGLTRRREQERRLCMVGL